MLFDSRTGQCIGPCVPSIAALPPATPYAPLQYTPAQFALLPASIPLEMPSKKKKPSTSSSSSSHSSTSTHTLQRKLKKRERAKAQSSRKKDKGRLPRSIRRRHRSKDGQSSAKPSRKKGQRQRSELRSPRKQPRTVSRSATRPTGVGSPHPMSTGTGTEQGLQGLAHGPQPTAGAIPGVHAWSEYRRLELRLHTWPTRPGVTVPAPLQSPGRLLLGPPMFGGPPNTGESCCRAPGA